MRGKGSRAETGCRCPPTSARRSSATCAMGARAVRGRPAGVLCAPRRRTGRWPLAGSPGRSAPPGSAPGSARSHAHRLRHSAATGMLRRGRVADRDRAGAAAPPPADDCDLRQGQTPRRCACWPGPGPVRPHEAPAAQRAGRLPGGPPVAGLPAGQPPRRLLGQFVIYLEDRRRRARSPPPTRWRGRCSPPGTSQAGTRSGSRRSAASPPTCTAIDPSAEVPPGRPDSVAGTYRATPYLYSDADIAALIAAAASLRPRCGRPPTRP